MDTTTKHQKPKKTTVAAYDSNPFTTSWVSIRKLFTINPQTFVGVIVATFGLCAALGLTVIAVLLATVAFAAKHFPNNNDLLLPPSADLSFFTSMSDASVYTIWGIGLVVGIGLTMLLQVFQLRFTISTARNVSVSFKRTFRESLPFIVPLLGLSGLLVLPAIIATVGLGLLAMVAPIVVYLLILALLLAAFYGGLRLSFASYAIIDKNLGPIAAIKHSWAITNGRLVDILGIVAATWLVASVPSIIFGALVLATQGIPALAGSFSILSIAVEIAMFVVAAMPMAERYVQSQAVYDKEIQATPVSPFNFLAILLVLLLSPVLAALSSTDDSSGDAPGPWGIPSLQQDTTEAPQGSSSAY